MSAPIVFPQIPILSLAGLGLNQGHVYIGVPGEDPVTNPQAVYWDADLTIPATQPLDVLGGYIMYLSSPAFAWTTGSYSFAAYAKDGTLVYQDLVVIPGFNSPAGPAGEDVDFEVVWTGPQTGANAWLGGRKVTRPVIFPAGWAGLQGEVVTTNPAASYTVSLKNGGTTLGTVTISTGGAFTGATTGGLPISLAVGDRFDAYGSGDAAIADFSIVFPGSVSA